VVDVHRAARPCPRRQVLCDLLRSRTSIRAAMDFDVRCNASHEYLRQAPDAPHIHAGKLSNSLVPLDLSVSSSSCARSVSYSFRSSVEIRLSRWVSSHLLNRQARRATGPGGHQIRTESP
jgi:hypothetical protein